ncbi:MAG: hypothetical protein ING91_19565 [Rhodocyclaceae bacterium]|nr:hypothetical protein [Rhodocyclaceae bacterium]
MGAPLAGVVHRAGWSQSGAIRNFYAGEGTVVAGASIANRSGFPSGVRHPASWSMAPKGGGMSSRYESTISLSSSGLMVGGITTTGTAALSLSATALGSLLAQMIGTTTITVGGTGFASASLNASGSATIAMGGTALLGALAGGAATGSLTVTGTAGMLPTGPTPPILAATGVIAMAGTLTPYATGSMIATTEESGLTPAGIANRVWGQVIEAGFSADQILRIVAAHAAGAATGLEGSNPQFTGLDGTTLRIDGTYNAGTRTIDALDGD